MPWKAKNRQYYCTGCGYEMGVAAPLKRVNPSGLCPQCGAKLKERRCKHPDVRQLGRHQFCTACNGIVEWVD